MTTTENTAPRGTAVTGKRNIEAIYPLSPMQQGMLFHSVMAPNSGVYCEQLTCAFRGGLDVEAFRKAWQTVIERHAVLRTSFAWRSTDKPLQAVSKEVRLPLTELDWRHLLPEEQERQFMALLTSDRKTGFELSRAPLLRLTLIREADEVHRFVWTHHHILLDGWSMPVLFGEMFALYDGLAHGRMPALPAVRPYKDYIAWLQAQDAGAAQAYWRKAFDGFEAPTPLAVERTTGRSAGSLEQEVRLSAEASAALLALARQQRVTLSTVVQAAWALLLSRYSGEDRVVFGATVSGRPATLAGADRMVGLFINTLPIRVSVPGDAILGPWLQALQAQLAELRQYEHSALVDIQGWSGTHRDVPLFKSIVVFENYPVEDALRQQLSGLGIAEVRTYEQTNYPLTFVSGPGRELPLKISYDAALFADETIGSMLSHLATLLAAMAEGAELAVGELPLLTDAEQRQISLWSAPPSVQVLPPATLHALFDEVAWRTPDAVAIVVPESPAGGERRVTYAELAARSDLLAHRLQALGVTRDTIVGLLAGRSPDLLTAILGILKAGGAYLPLDPAYPADRLAFMLEDSHSRLLVTAGASAPEELAARAEHIVEVSSCEANELPDAELAPVDPSALAYVIYTSGSTGTPKGVMIEHGSIANYIRHFVDASSLGPHDRVLQFVSPSFDAAGEEYFGALLSGAALVVPPDNRELTGAGLWEFCEAAGITFLHMPAAAWHAAVDDAAARQTRIGAPLRLLTLGGDIIDPERLARFARALGRIIPVANLYGPTEATIVATAHWTTTGTGEERIPIGKPVAGARIYLLDTARRPVPQGVTGEIYIGGPGVSRGYLNRPELTAERFLANPYGPGRLYRTGDLARWLPDGSLEFAGRADDQIKVRGFRVEPGEIEAALKELPDVREAVVVGQDDGSGSKRLVAFLVREGRQSAGDAAVAPDGDELRLAVRQILPDHMTPAAFVEIAALPLLPTGKIDRRALQHSSDGGWLPQRPSTALRTLEEELVAGIFGQVLNIPLNRVGAASSFFDLGGHSLSATRLASRLRDVFGAEIPLRALFDAPTVAGIAELVAVARNTGAAQITLDEIPHLPRDAQGVPIGNTPLSFSQQRLWFLDQLEPGNLFYNIPVVVRLKGSLNVDALRAALNALVARHEVLRTTFAASGGIPHQVVAPALTLDLPLTDLGLLPDSEREAAAREHARRELRIPFNLSTGPLLRCRLIRRAADDHFVVFTVHHSVADGWSMGILVAELAQAYGAELAGAKPKWPPLPIHYADFAAWQRSWLDVDDDQSPLRQQLAYWKERLAGLPERLDLPTDRPRPAVQTSNGATYTFTIDADLAESLRRVSQQSGVTLFMTLLAGYQTLLARYSGQGDLAVGTAIANRTRRELEGLIGFFVNTLVLRTKFDGAPSFKELLGRVRETALGAFAHQDVPFELLVDTLRPNRNLSHTPLFQAAFSWQNVPLPVRELPGVQLEPVLVDKGIAGFEMLLQMVEIEETGAVAASWDFNSDLFDLSTIERMAGHLITLLTAAAADPGQKVAALPLLTPAERRMMLFDWNATETSYPAVTFPALFAEWVARTPDAVAVEFVVDGSDSVRSRLTYGELDRRAERMAGQLRRAGVGPGCLVGVATLRSLDMIVAVLGVLKAGGAYLPLDPNYPPDRLSFMVEDSGVAAIVSQQALAERLHLGGRLIFTDASDGGAAEARPLPAATAGPDDFAYCIYTSGSTGRPKGALLRHRGLVNLTLVHRREFAMGPGQRVLQFAPFSFDASVWETAMALGNGATLVLTRQETLASGPELLRLLRAARITAATLPPSLLGVLEPSELPDLQTIIAAGEKCTNAIVAAWASGRRFFNAYGPTETTVCAAMQRCDDATPWPFGGPPIGKALSNFRMYVVDDLDQPQPIGVPGELLVGGPGLAAGYLNRPDLTAERFIVVPPPLSHENEPANGERLYRTGDLVRWLPDGRLDFLGRIDSQVKVRGYRIELGEIESVLRECPSVQDAVVAARGNALVGYVIPREGTQQVLRTEMTSHLRTRLPEYMIPSVFVTLPSFPLSPAGKVDRRALPEPGQADRLAEATFLGPRSAIEGQLAQLCAELLKLPQVGVNDNFFELGGHSLLATQLIARVRDTLHVELPLRVLFESPTVSGLAEHVAKAQDANKTQAEQAAKITETLKSVRDLSPEQLQAMLQKKRAAQGPGRQASGGGE